MGKKKQQQTQTQPTAAQPVRLDLGCGQHKREGFTGVDSSPECQPDIVCDLSKAPWPFEDNSVDEVHSSHFIEHLTGAERAVFFNELYRVMKKDAKGTFIVPHENSIRAIQDITHQWPPVSEGFLFYLSKEWRVANGIDHYHPLKCDFIATWGYGFADPAWATRQDEARVFGVKHYNNVAADLHFNLVKR
jgi:hypothetical protein